MRQFAYSGNQVTSETWYNAVADADAQHNATEVIDYSYDLNGNLTAEWDANSSIAYTYDSQGREATVTQTSTGAGCHWLRQCVLGK